MDKVTRYKKIAKEIAQEIGQLGKPSNSKIETQFIFDDDRGHYLLYFSGWYNEEQRTYGCFLHIDVNENGQVWVQNDGTDMEIAKMLVEHGIPKKDIVLGYFAPYRRALIEDFA